MIYVERYPHGQSITTKNRTNKTHNQFTSSECLHVYKTVNLENLITKYSLFLLLFIIKELERLSSALTIVYTCIF